MTAQGIVRRGERWPWWPALAALALLMLSLASFWPGVAMFDTVRQYEQVLSGRYNDWHPPVMARFWSLLLPLGRGTGPLFIAQLAAYWIGLGALAQALRGWKALAVLAIGASPVFLGWQIVVLKDAQMAGALVCATGLVAAFRLRGRRVPWPVIGVVALCLIYATLLRANAAFSTVPLTVLLAVPAGRRGIALAATLCGIPAAILASQIVNHAVLGARESGVSRSEAIYDLAAIAVRTGDAQASGIAPADIAALARQALRQTAVLGPDVRAAGLHRACAGAAAAGDAPALRAARQCDNAASAGLCRAPGGASQCDLAMAGAAALAACRAACLCRAQ